MLYDYFSDITFANLWVLPFLLMVPVLAWIHIRSRRALKSSLSVSTAATFKQTSGRNFFVQLPFWLRLLSLAALILALARPQIINSQTKTKGEGIDIVLCIDVSGSMLSPDFVPNRIQVAKQVASDFVKERPVDEIGLVIFSGESYTLSPLTTNHEAILEQIKSLRSGMLQDGTLIGEGLATSVDRLTQSKSKTKVVILLTDGKEEAPDTRIIDPLTALQITKTKGVRVYTIGMAARPGSFEETQVARRDASSSLDEVLLDRIARETGGEYFRATDKEKLQEIYSRIDKLEKSPFQKITKVRADEQYFYLVLAALFFLLLEALIKFTLLRTFP
jgi:Ca-activated chloride channel homolog